MSGSNKTLWGGRFTDAQSICMTDLNCSLGIDSRLFSEDIDGSKAYAKALEKAKIITQSECNSILRGLEQVRKEWMGNIIKFLPSDEDVHTVNERRLIEIIGTAGEKLHTGRSRNDQVITDVKLWMKKAIHDTLSLITNVIESMIFAFEKFRDIIMPGYTHLQRAQPVLFGHWLFSHAFALREDCLRFIDLLSRVDILPLGSGAIAGNPLGIDREFLCKELGFSGVTQNSMHAVGNRDYIVEFNFNSTMTALHLSRLAEDLIIYSTKEFQFITIADEYSTGSSLMPQKRNPDSLELIRGMCGQIFGSMNAMMVSMKGLPSTYNKDLQIDKKNLFEAFDSLQKILRVTEGVIRTMTVNNEKCKKALSADMLATDWAYYLVRKGIPFRTAHHFIGKLVLLSEKLQISLTELSLDQIKSVSDKFDEDIKGLCNFKGSVDQYNVTGGTSYSSVEKQYQTLRIFIATISKDYAENKYN